MGDEQARIFQPCLSRLPDHIPQVAQPLAAGYDDRIQLAIGSGSQQRSSIGLRPNPAVTLHICDSSAPFQQCFSKQFTTAVSTEYEDMLTRHFAQFRQLKQRLAIETPGRPGHIMNAETAQGITRALPNGN